MKCLLACAAVVALAACVSPPPPEQGEPVAHDSGMTSLEMQEWRSRLQRIDTAFRRDPEYFCLPPGSEVDVDKLQVSAVPFDSGTTVGSAMAEVQLLVLRRRDGRELVLPRVREITVSVAGNKLSSRTQPAYELDSTLAHELAHAYFAVSFPMLYVQSGDFDLIEGHAVSAQYRWIQRFYPGVSEEEFLATRPYSYRVAYRQFQREYMRGGLVDWQRVENRETALRSR